MKRTTWFLLSVSTLIFFSHLAPAELSTRNGIEPVSRYLTYEGALADPSGNPLNGEYMVTFRIYESPSASDLLWEETHRVTAASGEFRVVLGKETPLPSPATGSRYIGVLVDGEELLPRHRIGGDGISGDSPVPVGGGPGAIPYFPVEAMDERYVNVVGPDGMTGTGTASPVLLVGNTSGGTAIRGEGDGTSSSATYGVSGDAGNTSTGAAYGGYFTTSASGTGTHYGVVGDGAGSSTGSVRGIYGEAVATGSGEATGGKFYAGDAGTGTHYGLYAEGHGSSSGNVRGLYAVADNTGAGEAVGGKFYTSSSGSGSHTGVYSDAYAAAGPSTYGVDAWATHTGSGNAVGGQFQTDLDGTGQHYGVRAQAASDNGSSTYGIDSFAANYGSGNVYAGNFTTYSEGTGAHYGLYTSGYGLSSGNVRGIYAYADNGGSGETVGGRFWANSSGTGTHYGVYGYEAAGGTGAAVYAAGDMIASGAKPAVVRTSQGHRFLYAQESPEVWFEDVGDGRLVNGRVHIDLDPLFLETVTIDNEHPMKVFIQLTDENCNGTAVRSGMTGFDVIELAGGTSKATFSYRVMAKRRGYEDERFRQTDVGYNDPNLYPELLAGIEKEQEKEMHRQELEREQRRGGTGRQVEGVLAGEEDLSR